jgi:hypothetical protein
VAFAGLSAVQAGLLPFLLGAAMIAPSGVVLHLRPPIPNPPPPLHQDHILDVTLQEHRPFGEPMTGSSGHHSLVELPARKRLFLMLHVTDGGRPAACTVAVFIAVQWIDRVGTMHTETTAADCGRELGRCLAPVVKSCSKHALQTQCTRCCTHI